MMLGRGDDCAGSRSGKDVCEGVLGVTGNGARSSRPSTIFRPGCQYDPRESWEDE